MHQKRLSLARTTCNVHERRLCGEFGRDAPKYMYVPCTRCMFSPESNPDPGAPHTQVIHSHAKKHVQGPVRVPVSYCQYRCVQKQKQKHAHTLSHTHTHTHTHTHKHAQTHAQVQLTCLSLTASTDVCNHTNTHTHILTHTYTNTHKRMRRSNLRACPLLPL